MNEIFEQIKIAAYNDELEKIAANVFQDLRGSASILKPFGKTVKKSKIFQDLRALPSGGKTALKPFSVARGGKTL